MPNGIFVEMDGQKLKILREKHNLTQTELGNKIGVTQSRISKWENEENTISKIYQKVLKDFFSKKEKK